MKSWSLLLFVSVLYFFSRVAAAPTQKGSPPTVDSFYQAPDGFESAELGTILKSRLVPSSLRAVILPVQIEAAWQLLIRSSDSRGNATAIVATVIAPFNGDPKKLVTYSVAEDSPSTDCAVSWAIQVDAPIFANLVSEVDMLMVQTFLQEGWYVVTTDYEGPQGAFTAGIQSGHAILDALKATLNSTSLTGVSSEAKTIFYGYSGGALASGWAASLQPTYAPELKPHLLGASIGGFVTNISATVVSVEGGVFSGLIPSGINGILHEYPELLPIVKEDMTSNKTLEGLLWARDHCLVPSLVHYLFEEFFGGDNQYFKSGWGFFEIPEIKAVVDQNTLAFDKNGPMPEIPFFVFHSKNDEVAPYTEALRAYNNWCEWGIESFEFAVDEFNEHVTELIIGGPAGFSWMKGIFNGTAPVKGCSSTTRFSNWEYPGASHGLSEVLDTAYQSALQEPIGPVNDTDSDNTLGKRFKYNSPIALLKKRDEDLKKRQFVPASKE